MFITVYWVSLGYSSPYFHCLIVKTHLFDIVRRNLLIFRAFDQEKERQWRQLERDLRVQIAQLEMAIKADMNDKSDILNKISSERGNAGQGDLHVISTTYIGGGSGRRANFAIEMSLCRAVFLQTAFRCNYFDDLWRVWQKFHH